MKMATGWERLMLVTGLSHSLAGHFLVLLLAELVDLIAARCSRFSLMMSITSCHSHCGQQQMQARL